MSPKPRRPRGTPERDLERACTQVLEWDGWRALKTDPVSRREWGKGFGEKGMADYLYLRYCDHRVPAEQAREPLETASAKYWDFEGQDQIMWIEWKAPRGVPSASQEAWHLAERKRGALTLIAGQDFPATFEGFKEWYAKSGLQRKR